MRTSAAKRSLRNGHALSSDWIKVRSTLNDTASDFKKIAGAVLHDSANGLKYHSKKFQHKVGALASRKPFKTLGIAVLTGMAIGWWLRR